MPPGVSGIAPGIAPFLEGSMGVGTLSAMDEAMAGFGLIGATRLGGAPGGGAVGFMGIEPVAEAFLLSLKGPPAVVLLSCCPGTAGPYVVDAFFNRSSAAFILASNSSSSLFCVVTVCFLNSVSSPVV